MLNITVECNLWITDFLDAIFDLRTRKYYPYRKVNSELLYIHKQSNHPTTYHQAISCHVKDYVQDHDKGCVDKAAPGYNNTLKNSRFNENIKFTPQPHYTKILAKAFSGLIFTA